MSERLDLLKQVEELERKILTRRDSANRSAAEAIKADKEKIKILLGQVKVIDDKTAAQEKFADATAKVFKQEASFSKAILKNKKSINLSIAKSLGFYDQTALQELKTATETLKQKEISEEVIAQRKALNDLTGQALENQQNFVEGLDNQITKEEILAGISKEDKQNLKDAGVNVEKIAKAMAANSENAAKFSTGIQAGNAVLDEMKSLIGVPIGVAALVGLAVQFIGDFVSRTIDARKELGVSVGVAAELAAQQKALALEGKLFGITADDIAGIQKDILANLGGQSKVTTDLVRSFVKIQGTLGVTSDTASKLVPILDAVGAAGERGAVAQIESLGALIKLEGLSPGQILNDVASQAEFFAKFAKDGGTNLIRAAVSARKLGLELGDVASITESLLDFETSIEKQLEASLLLGRQINLDRARQLALTGDQEGLLEEIRRQVGSEAEFNRLNVLERKALADAFGTGVEQVARAVRGNTAAVTGAAAAGGGDELQRKSVSLLGDVVRNTGKIAAEI